MLNRKHAENGVRGSLVFIATHTDVIVRSEVAGNLNLAANASELECAHARNKYFAEKMVSEFNRSVQRGRISQKSAVQSFYMVRGVTSRFF